jgi:putative transcriptional regulator
MQEEATPGPGEGLACHLLCAVPQLLDPNFHRSVVLMLEHGHEGALGLVLTSEMPTTMVEIASALELEWRGDPEQLVRLGGPVEPARGWILHDDTDFDPGATTILGDLSLTTSLERAKRAGHTGLGDRGRWIFVLGYAGWGEGQLESEIAAGSWVLVPVFADESQRAGRSGITVDWLFDTAPERMWSQALHAIGIEPHRLVGLQGSGRVLQ